MVKLIKIKKSLSNEVKLKRTILFVAVLLLIFIVIFSPRSSNFTGKPVADISYPGWVMTGGSNNKDRFVDTNMASPNYIKYSLSSKSTNAFDSVLSLGNFIYIMTNQGISGIQFSNNIINVMPLSYSTGVFNNKFIISQEQSKIFSIKDIYDIYNIDLNTNTGELSSSLVNRIYSKTPVSDCDTTQISIQDNSEPIVIGNKVFIPSMISFKNCNCGASTTCSNWVYRPIILVYDISNMVTAAATIYPLSATYTDTAAGASIEGMAKGFYGNKDYIAVLGWGKGRISIIFSDAYGTVFTTDLASPCTLKTELVSKGNFVYFICGNNYLYKFDVTQGSGGFITRNISQSMSYAKNTLAVSNTKIYYGGEGKLSSFDSSTLAPLNSVILTGTVTAVAVVKDAVYAGTSGGYVYALNPNNLSILWSVNLGVSITSIIIPSENTMLAVGSYYSYLFPPASQAPQCTSAETICNDNLDNDCDGSIDILDSDCVLGCVTGTRNATHYCDADHIMQPFKSINSACTQNYECIRNICLSAKCAECISTADCNDPNRDCINNVCTLKSCSTIGLRIPGNYCDVTKGLQEFKVAGSSCNQHYECIDNICDDSVCKSYTILQQTYCYLLDQLDETNDELC